MFCREALRLARERLPMFPIVLSLSLLLSDPAGFDRLPFPQQMATVAPWFDPPPGGMVMASPEAMAKLPASYKADGKKIKGFVTVTPPKGHCVRVIKGLTGSELPICRRKVLSFRLDQLDQSGVLRWQVFAGRMFSSLPLVWQSPYRFAQVIELGMLGKKLGHYEPVTNCRIRKEGPWVKATVDFLDGRRLKMDFHRDDSPLEDLDLGDERMANNGKVPDNMVHERDAAQAQDGEHFANDPENDPEGRVKQKAAGKAPVASAKEGSSLGAIINSHMGKRQMVRQYGWILQHRKAREMNGSRVYFEKINGDTIGKCRYVFLGSPLNPAEGMVECSYANDFDAILVPLSCTGALGTKAPAKRKR